MKLYEILESSDDKSEIQKYVEMLLSNANGMGLRKCEIVRPVVHVGTNMKITSAIKWDGNLNLDFHDAFVNGKLPFAFDKIKGYFKIAYQDLNSLENFPTLVEGVLSIRANKITKFIAVGDGIHVTNDVAIIEAGITSLVDIDKFFARIDGDLQMRLEQITEGGLGLLNIEGLNELHNYSMEANSVFALPPPFEIIAKYLREPHKIFECQEELINAGFDEFAKL